MTDWFDGANEDNKDRDAQRKIFCEGRCTSGDNAKTLPCKHSDVAPPRTTLINGPKLCKDKKWKTGPVNINDVKTKLPGADDE